MILRRTGVSCYPYYDILTSSAFWSILIQLCHTPGVTLYYAYCAITSLVFGCHAMRTGVSFYAYKDVVLKPIRVITLCLQCCAKLRHLLWHTMPTICHTRSTLPYYAYCSILSLLHVIPQKNIIIHLHIIINLSINFSSLMPTSNN